jgi:hypothetical protein
LARDRAANTAAKNTAFMRRKATRCSRKPRKLSNTKAAPFPIRMRLSPSSERAIDRNDASPVFL